MSPISRGEFTIFIVLLFYMYGKRAFSLHFCLFLKILCVAVFLSFTGCLFHTSDPWKIMLLSTFLLFDLSSFNMGASNLLKFLFPPCVYSGSCRLLYTKFNKWASLLWTNLFTLQVLWRSFTLLLPFLANHIRRALFCGFCSLSIVS